MKKAKIVIHPDFVTGDISPELYGFFMEPIGRKVNGTMYAPGHFTADCQGFREDVIEELKKLNIPAVRLPGGNFVSGWDWKDSIGPKEKRKAHLDLAWHQYVDNEVGHDEYLQWTEKINAMPMYTINLGTGNIREAMELIEYTNHEGGTFWSELRKENGHREPYGVKVWYLGNEADGPWQIASWERNPKGYGMLANEVSKALKWIDPSVKTVACVSSSPFQAHYPQWDEDVLRECYESVDYISLHHYHSAPKGDYRALLGGACYFEDYINTEIALCDLIQAKLRSPRRMLLSFDEYGVNVEPVQGIHPGTTPHNIYEAYYVFDQNQKYIRHDPDNMPDFNREIGDMPAALAMACVQLVFLRHADRVKIACMTDGLEALCASDNKHIWKSASYYILTQLMQYGKGKSLQVYTESETFDLPGYAIDDNRQYAEKKNIPWIDTAAAWDEDDGRVTVFVINRNPDSPYQVELDASAFGEYRFTGHMEMYTDDMDEKNTFEQPELILPHAVSDNDIIYEEKILTARVKPFSWNIFHFEKET